MAGSLNLHGMNVIKTLLFIALTIIAIIWAVVRFTSSTDINEYDEVVIPDSTYNQPQPGDFIKIRLDTGRMVPGIIEVVDTNQVLLATPTGPETFSREDISPESRQMLFEEDFYNPPSDNKPDLMDNQELLEQIATGNVNLNSNVEYIIMGDRSIFFMYPGSPDAEQRPREP